MGFVPRKRGRFWNRHARPRPIWVRRNVRPYPTAGLGGNSSSRICWTRWTSSTYRLSSCRIWRRNTVSKCDYIRLSYRINIWRFQCDEVTIHGDHWDSGISALMLKHSSKYRFTAFNLWTYTGSTNIMVVPAGSINDSLYSGRQRGYAVCDWIGTHMREVPNIGLFGVSVDLESEWLI